MADRAIGELVGLYVVCGDERFAQAFLVSRILVSHIKDLVSWTDKLGRVAMAFEAPFHIQRMGLPHQGHLVNLAVARLTADALVDVDAVVEINEVWQVVHPVPTNGLIVAEAGPHGFEDRRFGPDLRVTGHAGLGGGDASKGTYFDRGMAIAAVYAHAGNVVLMAEVDGLVNRHVDLIDKVDAVDIEQDSQNTGHDEEDGEDAGLRSPVGAAREYLSHVLRLAVFM